MSRKNFKKIKQYRGQASIMGIIMIIVLLSFATLSIDVGHIFIVRSQLQNAADSLALRGAAYLLPSVSNAPNWALAQTKILSGISSMKVENLTLTNADMVFGFWDLTGATSTLKSINITPGVQDAPAVQVTISKAPGKNGGPVELYLGKFLGLSTINLSATAIGVTGSPSSVNANTLFPVAMSSTVYNTFWDSASGSPKIDPLTGKPYVFFISEGPTGGWTSFNLTFNDTTSLINIIQAGNPIPLAIGDQIWLAPGVKTAVYDNVPVGKDVIVAVTEYSIAGTFQKIVGFGALHIDAAVGGSLKYIQVHFTNNVKLLEGDPGGPNYGVYTPPRLAK